MNIIKTGNKEVDKLLNKFINSAMKYKKKIDTLIAYREKMEPTWQEKRTVKAATLAAHKKAKIKYILEHNPQLSMDAIRERLGWTRDFVEQLRDLAGLTSFKKIDIEISNKIWKTVKQIQLDKLKEYYDDLGIKMTKRIIIAVLNDKPVPPPLHRPTGLELTFRFNEVKKTLKGEIEFNERTSSTTFVNSNLFKNLRGVVNEELSKKRIEKFLLTGVDEEKLTLSGSKITSFFTKKEQKEYGLIDKNTGKLIEGLAQNPMGFNPGINNALGQSLHLYNLLHSGKSTIDVTRLYSRSLQALHENADTDEERAKVMTLEQLMAKSKHELFEIINNEELGWGAIEQGFKDYKGVSTTLD